MGDTLVNTHHERREMQYAEILEKFGYKINRKEFPLLYEKTRKDFMKKYYSTVYLHQKRFFFEMLLERLGQSADKKTLVRLEGENNKVFLEELELYPGVIGVLKFCKNKNLVIGAISNNTTEGMKRMMKKFHLSKYFDIILISEEMRYEKSSLVPFKLFIAKTGLKPKECLMVGNRQDEDMLAKKVGMKTVLVSKVNLPVVGDSESADYEIGNIKDIIPIIRKLTA